MTAEEYLKKLEALRSQSQRAIIDRVPSLEKFAYQLMVNYVDDNLDVKGGHFVQDEQVLLALNGFVEQYLGAFTTSKQYSGAVAQYLKNFKDIGTLITEFQKSQGLDVKKANITSTQEVVVNEIINRYTENGLNAGFVQPLRELLFNNVTGGLSKQDALAQLGEYIQGGKDTSGKLHLYLEQTAQQGVDSYTGAINTRIMQTFKINTLIINGSLIQTSSPQCRYAINQLGGLIDRADWPDLEKIAMENGLIEGTTFDNLSFNRLHWGCRHEFTPAVLNSEEREAITQTQTNG